MTSITDLGDAVHHFELTDVVAYEHTARRVDNDVTADDAVSPTLSAMFRQEPGRLEARFRMSTTCPNAELVTAVGVVFTSDDDAELAPGLVTEFLGEIAIMAAYPFLREGISTSAARLGAEQPVLGLIRRGSVSFNPDDVQETAETDQPPEPAVASPR